MTTIYHNPRCRKSRETLQLLQDRSIDPEIVLYLESPPSVTQLKSLLRQLNLKPAQLIRKGEAIWKEQFKGKELSDQALIQAMIDHPKLMERPIVVHRGKAKLGRPPEQVLELF